MATKTKLLSLLLAAIMVVGMFAGCSSQSDTPVESPAESPTQSAPPSEAPDTPAQTEPEQSGPAETEPPAPPEEVKAPMYPLDESVNMTMWSIASPDVFNALGSLANHEVFKAAEEATNVHFKLTEVSIPEASVQFSLMAASNEYTDIIKCFSSHYGANGITGALNDEIIIDLTPYVEEFAPDYYAIITAEENTWRGATDAESRVLGFYNMKNNPVSDQGMAIRQDLLDEQGLDMPVTFAEYTNALSIFMEEYGMKNAYFTTTPFTSMGTGAGGDVLSSGFNASMDFYQKDGKIVYGPLQEEYYDYMKQVHEWYELGIINTDFFNYSDNPLDTTNFVIKQSDDTALFSASAADINSYVTTNTTGRANYRLVATKNPIKDENFVNKMGMALTIVNPGNQMATVSTACKDIEAACKYINYWFTEEGAFLANYGFEDVTYSIGDNGYPVFTDLIMHNPDGIAVNVARQIYLLYTQMPCYQDAKSMYGAFSQDAIEAADIWAAENNTDFTMPANMTMLQEYSTDYNTIMADIYTLNQENWLGFVTGSKELNEQNWNDYMNSIKSMNIDTATGYYQETLDVYLNK